MFSINIVNIPTISSLAMAIYRSNFMDSDTKIAITDLKTYEKLQGPAPARAARAEDIQVELAMFINLRALKVKKFIAMRPKGQPGP